MNPWIERESLVQHLVHSIISLFPTITWFVLPQTTCNPNFVTTNCSMKLWVLPLSMSTINSLFPTLPITRKVYRCAVPAKAWNDISRMASSDNSMSISILVVSSSICTSTIINICGCVQWCPGMYLSSQLKHNQFSRLSLASCPVIRQTCPLRFPDAWGGHWVGKGLSNPTVVLC